MQKLKKLLVDNEISASELPTEIQTALTSLNEMEYDMDELDETGDDADSAEIGKLKTRMNALESEICSAIETWLDDEIEDEPTADELQSEYLQNISVLSQKVSISNLTRAGIELPDKRNFRIERHGFRIEKKMFEDKVSVIKL